MTAFTPEQAAAIERRHGNLLLDASAGSGKTTVLVERFARAVVEDGLDVGQILAITFTEKAAAELKGRVRRRFIELGRRDLVLVALTFAAGSVDAVVFLRLEVFTAVMTGNIVFLGVAIGQGAVRNALRSLVALAAYATGVLIGSRLIGTVPRDTSWSPRLARALGLEWTLQAVFLAGWIVSAGAPDGFAAAALIACSGVAMGTQAAAARGLAPGMPTTYVTGTLTALLSELSALGGLGADWWRRAAIVLALGVGAVTGALVLVLAPLLAPAVPLVVVGVVLALGRAP